MGSGSSKPKTQEKTPPARSDNVSKSSRQLKIEKNEKSGLGGNEKITNNTKTDNNKFQTVSVTTNKNSNEKKNGKVKNNETSKTLGNFESDSESEAGDINAVLEATRNEYNSQLREQNLRKTRDNDASYPETYAQRLQREQYRNQPQGILRQKTIYRNPDEWEVDENETQSFDVSKFKQANVNQRNDTEEDTMLSNDIFTPEDTEVNEHRRMAPDPESYYFQPNQKKKSLPHYDTSEEALLDEIEKEFDL
ncbi:uncharacterized protein LOC132754430 isoform X2 [Ruditapes philippinarum]|uniref:uncharacterized protein LOC132754430 isoform X2 n=1 Tax=Ruditapes philippinarum TaxID=129788 RepID=UPI00295BB74B|nr:uncharacterized protein LOC132754430 isoform X2 [Ruditapes philippinarum]